jgi:hypothetical protein
MISNGLRRNLGDPVDFLLMEDIEEQSKREDFETVDRKSDQFIVEE